MGGIFVESLKLAVPLTEAMAANMERIAAANGSLATIAPGSPATIVIGGGGASNGKMGGGSSNGGFSEGSGVKYGGGFSEGGGVKYGGGFSEGGGGIRYGPGTEGGGVRYGTGTEGSSGGGVLMSSRDGAAIVGALKALGDRLEKSLNSGGLRGYFRATGGL